MSDENGSAGSGEVAQAIADSGAGEATGGTVTDNASESNNLDAAAGAVEAALNPDGSPAAVSRKEVVAAAQKVDAKQSKTDPEKYTITVDGEKMNVSKEELVKFAQMGKAGQKRMQEAAQLKNDVLDLLRTLKSNPLSVLKDPALGIDPLKLANEIISRQAEEEAKTPEQRERDLLQQEVEELRRQMKESEDAKASAEEARLLQETEVEMESEITEAIQELGLPRKPAVLKRIADIMLAAMDAKKNITIKQAATIANKELNRDFNEMVSSLSDESLESFLGKDLLKRIRTSDLKRVKNPVVGAQEQPRAAAAPKPSKPVHSRDWLSGKVKFSR